MDQMIGDGGRNPLEAWFWEMPICTRWWTTATVLTSALVQCQMVTPFQLFYSVRTVFHKGEYWRLLTTFLYFGPFSLDLLFHVYFLQRYARLLEESSGRSPAHFSWLLVYSMAFLILLSPLVSMPFLGHPLSSTLVYIWSRRNPDTRLSFLGLLVFTAPYLPWVLMGFSLVMHGTVPKDEIMGVVIGHIWYFFTDVYPPMHNGSRPLDPPMWWRRLFEGRQRGDTADTINNEFAVAGGPELAPADGDQRLPHDSGRDINEEELKDIGVLYYRIPELAGVDALAHERDYKNRDEITVSPAKMGDAYESKVRMFFDEHLHEDEEIRYIRDGKGYFDVRSKGDEWVRIQLEKDDLIILPAGIYHRFTTDEDNYIQAMRLFKEEPKWTPLNRSNDLDGNEYRKACEPPLPNSPRKQLVFGGTGHMGRSLVKCALARNDLVTDVGRTFETSPESMERGTQNCLGMLCDVRARQSVACVIEKTLERFGRIDVIANCSGYGVIGACEDQDEHEIRNQFETNFMGTLHIIQASLPYFRSQSTGRYLIFSSTSGALGVPGLGPYCATKYAVEGLIEAMSYEIDSFNVKATLVEPGLVRRDEPDSVTNPLPTWGHFLIKPASEAYAHPSSPALHAKRMVQWLGDRQPTSAVKCAELVWQLGHCSYPPLRLVLGSYAIESIRDRLRSVTEELEDWKHLNYPAAPDTETTPATEGKNAEREEDIEDMDAETQGHAT
ncbi:hypothetical protein GQX73_g7793 [Xylaria multiplex]|uniref:Acireductone dioxygenase n=1 Tax=Xylaria multiplex TaxID=323545 RepID=A0A7C8INN3_9PEZI|nr:hypothetical protein GQX73_g7793 [Xylaria multiplex]